MGRVGTHDHPDPNPEVVCDECGETMRGEYERCPFCNTPSTLYRQDDDD